MAEAHLMLPRLPQAGALMVSTLLYISLREFLVLFEN